MSRWKDGWQQNRALLHTTDSTPGDRCDKKKTACNTEDTVLELAYVVNSEVVHVLAQVTANRCPHPEPGLEANRCCLCSSGCLPGKGLSVLSINHHHTTSLITPIIPPSCV